MGFLETNSFFHSCKHGSIETFFCETQLLSFTNSLFGNADSGFDTDCISLYFSKAFETVSHELLSVILDELNLNLDQNILSWI